MRPRTILKSFAAVVGGLVLLVGGLWALGRLLSDRDTLYRGRSSFDWSERVTNGPPAVRNEALEVIRQEVVPGLIRCILTDTNDSATILALAEGLNRLPGLEVHHVDALGRRIQAVHELSLFGTNAAAAIPLLTDWVRRDDENFCEAAAQVLPGMGADAAVLVPLLIARLTNSLGQGRSVMVEALGEYGTNARAAVPNLIGLLGDRSSKEIRWTVPKALQAIDPAAAERAGIK